jgi:RND family efflux transporter MFP subunit
MATFPVSGILEQILVSEGDTVKKGQLLAVVSSQAQKLNRDNASLARDFADEEANQTKLKDAEHQLRLLDEKVKLDSALYQRQRNLFANNIGTQVELEQRELAYRASVSNFLSAVEKYKELKKQIKFSAKQAQKNLQISSKLLSDYQLKSYIDGMVYQILKKKGEFVSSQSQVMLLGSYSDYYLEMQVDESDIMNIKPGQQIFITLESYKNKVYEAKVSKIFPIMNERSKTFLVEGEFVNKPPKLYPNISFEANIVLRTKENALLVPRNYLLNNNKLITIDGDTLTVNTGLKDFQYVEILDGITPETQLAKP